MTHLGSLPRGFRVVRLAGDVLVGPVAFLLAFLVRLYVPVPLTRSLLPLDRLSFYAEHWIPVVLTQVAILYFFAFYDPPQPASRPELLRRLIAATCLQGLILMGYYFLRDLGLPALGAAPVRSAQLPAPLHLAAAGVESGRRAGGGLRSSAPARRRRRWRRACVATPATGSSWWDSSRPSPVGAGGRRPGVRRRARARVGNGGRRAAAGVEWNHRRHHPGERELAMADRLIDALAKTAQPTSNVWLLPGPFESLIAGTRFSWVDDHPLIEVARDPDWRINWPLKRVFDVVVGGLLLIALSPVLLVGAACVLIDSGRPIFYRQVRIGRGGRPFTIVKLRTMRAGAEDSTGRRWRR